MVKIRKYQSQKGINKSQAREFTQLRVNPNDFSAVSDQLNKLAATGMDVGLDLFSQQEKNDAIKYEEKKRQELKLYEQVEKNEVDYLARKLKLDRSNSLTENMNLAMDGNDIDDGLINRNAGDILNWATKEFGSVALDHSFSNGLFILVIYK